MYPKIWPRALNSAGSEGGGFVGVEEERSSPSHQPNTPDAHTRMTMMKLKMTSFIVVLGGAGLLGGSLGLGSGISGVAGER
jgi:hypothetical protein